ncbi:NFACT family protein [Peptoniphilus sp. oral taxon 386]|uniref:Rqc2 family fibronectin-binding protein n=1 Tax=Peptoniphilus sp. oral taxon 386 TaxID=652713 RepID=UPI0001DA9B5B|nr:NFACT RNA binding domain-containing protein [Peptoniphilus sp. oral taxon 386]EFI42340.1 putative fibronectin-binding protein [Peptoniphilus sp. oral taxon 386 str. F0131]
MSYDGSTLRAIVYELNEKISNTRIEKIYQPSNEELIFNLRNSNGKYKLLINAGSNAPRVYLTDEIKENPTNPPAFCMLLRKHLEGFKILNFSQYKMDRILRINILSKNELGDELEKSLFVEIMGKHSNIILTRSNDLKIYDSIKRVNSLMSSIREILPSTTYSIEPISNKIDPISKNSLYDSIEFFDENKSIKNNLIKTYTGLSPTIVREIAYRANIDENRMFFDLSPNEKEKLIQSYDEIIRDLKNHNYYPIIIKSDNNLIDFSCIDLKMYPEKEKQNYNSISEAVKLFYSEKSITQLINDKSYTLKKLVKNYTDREIKKLEKQSQELNEAIDREKYKIYADLISANSYKIEKGANFVILENFYENMNLIKIPLDEKLSATSNANKYYKKYSKLKNAAIILEKEIEKTNTNIEYLKSILLNIRLSENSSDIDEIREELIEMGFIKKINTKKKKISSKMNFLEYKSSEGYTIICGKNNKQNEYISLKLAGKDDLWFHVKNAPGSHVILKNNGNDFSQKSIEEAAQIAALNSSLLNSDNIEVDYTKRINIKRHPSKILGLISYTNYNTINIKKKDLNINDIEKIK